MKKVAMFIIGLISLVSCVPGQNSNQTSQPQIQNALLPEKTSFISSTMDSSLVLDSNRTTFDAGSAHTLVIKTDNSLWSFGANYYGQLGNGTRTDSNRPTQIMTDVISVSAGVLHSLYQDAGRSHAL